MKELCQIIHPIFFQCSRAACLQD